MNPSYLLPNMAVISRISGGEPLFYQPITLAEYNAAITANRLPLPPGWMCTQYHESTPAQWHGSYTPDDNGIADLQRAALLYVLPTLEVRDVFARIIGLQPTGATSAVAVRLNLPPDDGATLAALDSLRNARLILPYHLVNIGGSPRKVVMVNLTVVGFALAKIHDSLPWQE